MSHSKWLIWNVEPLFQISSRYLFRGGTFQKLLEVNPDFVSRIQSQFLKFCHRYHHPKRRFQDLARRYNSTRPALTINFMDISTSSRSASSVSSSEGNFVKVFRRRRNSSSRVINPFPFKSYVRKTTENGNWNQSSADGHLCPVSSDQISD